MLLTRFAPLRSSASRLFFATNLYNFKEEPQEEEVVLPPRKPRWTKKRCGAIGVKVGMINIADKWGENHTCTVVLLDDVQVTQVKREETEGYTALQVGACEMKVKNAKKPQLYHTLRNGIPPKRRLTEFRVTEDCLLDVGTRITPLHFVPGQMLDVTGKGKGKGFQGPMKRWGFAGLSASHGVSKAHRSHGSTGSSQDPGRVWKGKKMAGRMGGRQSTIMNLKLMRIDLEKSLLYIRGHLPGPKGGLLKIQDARGNPHFPSDPPVPTFDPEVHSTEHLNALARVVFDEEDVHFQQGAFEGAASMQVFDAPVSEEDGLKPIVPNSAY
jgi:large subunit ribosomal protein L3